jgi:EmrB/QacA subfamily drug resistance transporter
MRRTVLIPLIVACALFMENMDSTVIATSLPAIASDLGEPPLALKLALTSYLVSLAVFIPVSGWVADRFGSRKVFAAAIVTFAIGSVLCALAGSLSQFVLFRFLQGVGGAMMVPVGRLVLMRAIPKQEYVAALNYLTIPALIGPVVGPALGGAITMYADWRWIFLINIPISVLGVYLVLRHIPDVREDASPPFDLRGFFMSGFGLSVLMLGLSAFGGHLMPRAAAALCVAAGSAMLLLYARHAMRTAHPVIDLRLFRLHTFRDGTLVASLFRIGIQSTPFLLPLLLQLGFGLDPLRSGLITCAAAVGSLFVKSVTSAVLRRFGFRQVLIVNGTLCALSVAVFACFGRTTPHALIMVLVLLSGCLRSLQFTALQALSFADIHGRDMSQAASVSSMVQRLSQSMGIALAAYLLQLASTVQGHETIVAGDFPPTFIAIALVALLAPFLHTGTDTPMTISSYPDTRLLIANEWVDAAGGKTIPVLNPATGQAIGNGRPCQHRRPGPRPGRRPEGLRNLARRPAAERAATMRRAASLLRERAGDIARLLTQEQGKPLAEAKGKPWPAPRSSTGSRPKACACTAASSRRATRQAQQLVLKEPVGPVAAFTPWNFPINQIVRKLSAALATGCSFLCKAPEETPASPAALLQCFVDAGVPAGVVGLVFGDPAEISAT